MHRLLFFTLLVGISSWSAWVGAETGFNIACNEINGKLTNCGPYKIDNSLICTGPDGYAEGKDCLDRIESAQAWLHAIHPATCEQRMREAMQNRSTQEYLKKRWMFRWAEESNKGKRYAIWEQMREDERLKELNARWDQTMNDCVEGR